MERIVNKLDKPSISFEECCESLSQYFKLEDTVTILKNSDIGQVELNCKSYSLSEFFPYSARRRNVARHIWACLRRLFAAGSPLAMNSQLSRPTITFHFLRYFTMKRWIGRWLIGVSVIHSILCLVVFSKVFQSILDRKSVV